MLGIAGLVILPLICSVLGIIFGMIGRNDVRQDPSLDGMGMATAGLVTGIIGLAVWPLVILAAL